VYFRVGNPLGYYKDPDLETAHLFKVEVCDEFVMICAVFGFTSWTNLKTYKSDDDTIQEVAKAITELGYAWKNDKAPLLNMQRLVKKGVAIHASSNEELFDKIRNFRVCRNGFPSFDIESMINACELKPVLEFADIMPVSELQMEIWRNADSTRTFEQIYYEAFSDIALTDYMENVIHVNNEGAIYIF